MGTWALDLRCGNEHGLSTETDRQHSSGPCPAAGMGHRHFPLLQWLPYNPAAPGRSFNADTEKPELHFILTIAQVDHCGQTREMKLPWNTAGTLLL